MSKRKVIDDSDKHKFDGMSREMQGRTGRKKVVTGDRNCLSRSVVVHACMHAKLLQSRPTLWPQPARLLCSWDSPGKNTGVGCCALLQGIFPNPGIKPKSPAWQVESLSLSSPGKPQHRIYLVLMLFWNNVFTFKNQLFSIFVLLSIEFF